MVCNLGVECKGELQVPKMGAPSLYEWENSRSIRERDQEHWGAANKMDKKSHMVKY